LHVGFFEGELWVEEKVLEDGTLFEHTGYMLQNTESGVTLNGIGSGVEKTHNQIKQRIKEYYDEHADEAKKFMKLYAGQG